LPVEQLDGAAQVFLGAVLRREPAHFQVLAHAPRVLGADGREAREGVEADDLAEIVHRFEDRAEVRPGHEAGPTVHADLDHGSVHLELLAEDLVAGK